MATDWKQNERGESAMKLWQKLYIVLIVPILIILNIAIYLLFGITYRQNIQAEKNQAIGDFGMIIDHLR